MKKVSLEKQIAEIVNNGNCVEDESNIIEVKTGNGKYTFPSSSKESLIKAARNMFRKAPDNDPVPVPQKTLAVLNEHRDIIPLYRQYTKRHEIIFAMEKTGNYKMREAEKIVYNLCMSDKEYILSIMPKAWQA